MILLFLCQRMAPMGLDPPIAGRVGENYLVSRIASILYGNMWGLPAPTPRGSLLDVQK